MTICLPGRVRNFSFSMCVSIHCHLKSTLKFVYITTLCIFVIIILFLVLTSSIYLILNKGKVKLS
jgi:hypothetical protein